MVILRVPVAVLDAADQLRMNVAVLMRTVQFRHSSEEGPYSILSLEALESPCSVATGLWTRCSFDKVEYDVSCGGSRLEKTMLWRGLRFSKSA